MKKDLIFAPILVLVGVALLLLRFTGMTAHIIVSVAGLAVLVVYAVLAKKEWKLPALEIAMRVLYGIALITGIVMMNVNAAPALAILHKLSAVLFLILLLVLLASKLFFCKRVEKN